MSRGQITAALDGTLYDSQAEALVADHLAQLQQEGLIEGYFAHPYAIGLSFDFVVQFPHKTSHISLDLPDGSLCFLEYDGLQDRRDQDLAPKIDRHGQLLLAGFDVRWLTDNSYEAVRTCLTSYKPPVFIQKVFECDCGQSRSISVIATKPDLIAKKTIFIPTICPDCSHDNNSD